MTVSELNVRRPLPPAAWRRHGGIALVMAAVLLSACAKRDSITVGAVPDDYRTNHPIVIAEGDEVLDLPVNAFYRGMTGTQRSTLDGFLYRHDARAISWVTILVPVGAVNEAAARDAAADFAARIRARGIPAERIDIRAYAVGAPDVAAPVRIAATVMKASAGPCGRWPEDILETSENRHYANFGCAYQNNLAAQVADPGDFLGPRRMTEIDAENRDAAIADYKDRIVSDRFADFSEVDY